MAETKEQIMIDVKIDTKEMQMQLSQAVQNVQQLSREQKILREQIEKGNDAEGTFAKHLAETNAELEKNKRQVKSQTALMQAALLQEVKVTDSLDEQRQALNTLQKAYASMSGQQKIDADQAGGLRDKIKELTESIKEQEHAIGDDRRNVGNYTESMIKAADSLGPMKGLIEGVSGETTQLSIGFDRADKVAKGLMKNPLWGTFFLLGGILSTIAAKLKKNEQVMQPIQKLTAGIGASLESLQPILDALLKYLVDGLTKALEWATKAIKTFLGWVDKIAGKFGKSLNLAGAFEEGSHAAKEFTEEEKKAMEEHAKNLAELREELRRRRLSDEERELDDLDKKLKEELKMTGLSEKERAEITAYYESEKDKVRQKYIDAETDRLNKLDAAARKAQEEAAKALEAQRKAVEAINAGLDEEEEGEDTESVDDLCRKWFGMDQETIDYFIALVDNGVSVSDAKMQAFNERSKRRVKEFGDAMGDLGGSFDGLAKALDDFGESSDAAKKAQRAFALASIIANQAQSISAGAVAVAEGMAQSQSVPFPANIAAMATTFATITGMLATTISSFTQAKSVLGGAYATGGIIPGRYDARDDVSVQLSKGEMVLNPAQQTRLFEIANGTQASAYESTFEAMRLAMASMPAPVLTYEEFNTFTNKTATYKEIASI